MDNNSFKNALTELEAIKAKALSVQQEIDSSRQGSLSLAQSIAQQEAQTVTTYAEQAATAKISSIKDVDAASEKRAKKFVQDWSDAFLKASSYAKEFGSTTGSIFQDIAGDIVGQTTGSNVLGQLASKLLGGIFGGGFGGYFADGGRPDPDKVSLVGERGPELFVPDTAGTVVPNDEIGKSSSPVVYQHFVFQSLDPVTNMKLLQSQKEQIQAWVADGIKNNQSGLRSAVKAV